MGVSGNTIEATDASGEVQLAPASGGKIVAGSVQISTSTSATTVTQNSGDLTLSAASGNIVLAPTGAKKIKAANLEISGTTIASTGSTSMTFNPPSAQNLI